MKRYKYPSLYQINTRVWMTELSLTLGQETTLDDIPDNDLDRLADLGFNWIWLLSVWRTGKTGRKVSLENREWRREFQEALPDLKDEDIGGSGFAIREYCVSSELGGNLGLKKLRARLAERNLKLMLDFVPNHMGPDHPWVKDHPDYFISGTENDLELYPRNYTRMKHRNGDLILAYGRDPYFAGWPDTLQLDYSNPAAVKAMKNELFRISGLCDGLRCDMAMLILPEVFERTWGRRAQDFWPETINEVHTKNPDFCFLAEVYWDMEWIMQQQGFNYTYDKRLYDRLSQENARAVRAHLSAGLDYQDKMARFLENHDEPRAASTFNLMNHKAAAVITFLSPGLRFFHQGQFEGRYKRISPHLVRAPWESTDQELKKFYDMLLIILQNPVLRNGRWSMLECLPAWEGNGTWDSFIVFLWEGENEEKTIVTVNYAPNAGQCYVRLHLSSLAGKQVRLTDLLGTAVYDREGDELAAGGLYLALPAWGFHIFEVSIPEIPTENFKV